VIDTARARQVAEAFGAFLSDARPPGAPAGGDPAGGDPAGGDSAGGAAADGGRAALELFRRTAATVPAYREFLREHGIDPGEVTSLDDFRRVPMTDKESYHRRYPLPARCRDGRLDGCDLVSVSSGSSGSPTIWPRTVTDELAIARRFEQVFRDGECRRRPGTAADL
jgi:hypothetical protein